MKKKWLGLGLGILILFTGYFWPETAGLTQPGKMSIAILMAGIVLWVTEVMPLAITALLLMVCMPYFEIFNWSTTWSKFISSVIFFIIATLRYQRCFNQDQLSDTNCRGSNQMVSREFKAFSIGIYGRYGTFIRSLQ